MHGPQNLHRTLWIGDRGFQQGRFVCAALSFGMPRPRVPRRRHNALIVLNLLVFNVHPVSERSPRRLMESPALRLCRPGVRLPLFAVMYTQVAVLELVAEFGHPLG